MDIFLNFIELPLFLAKILRLLHYIILTYIGRIFMFQDILLYMSYKRLLETEIIFILQLNEPVSKRFLHFLTAGIEFKTLAHEVD